MRTPVGLKFKVMHIYSLVEGRVDSCLSVNCGNFVILKAGVYNKDAIAGRDFKGSGLKVDGCGLVLYILRLIDE